MNGKLEEIIERVGGNTDKLKTNLDTERYDMLISCLGGNPKELLTNLETEKLDKLIELLGGDISTLKTNLKSEKFNKIIELKGGKPVTNNYLDEITNLFEELNEIEVEGQDITITDSTASNCSIEIIGNTEQEVRDSINLTNYKDWTPLSGGTILEQSNNKIVFQTSLLCYAVCDITRTLKPNTTYTAYAEDDFTGTYLQYGFRVCLNGSWNAVTNRTLYTFTTDDTGLTQIGFYVGSPYTTEGDILTLSNIRLYEGTYTLENIPEYEPYGSCPSPEYPSEVKTVKGNCEVILENEDKTRKQTYQLTIPEQYELAKIGDYEDYYYKENDKWYKYSRIGEKTLDGNENWGVGYSQDLTNTNLFYHNISGQNQSYGANTVPAICNCFEVERVWGNDFEGTCIQSNNGALMVRVNKERLKENTVSGFKSWVSENDITIMYELAEPVIEEITDKTLLSQLNSLEKARTYYGTTHINTNAEMTPTLKVTYKQIKG